MTPEIIDLTKSSDDPLPTPPPRILQFGGFSAEQTQLFERVPSMAFNAANNPNLRHQQATLWLSSANITSRYQTYMNNMHADHSLSLLPQSNSFLFPNATTFRESSWTPTEHELFLMGLIKYGKGRWGKIARHFLWNKTPQQVQSYATSFFKRLPYEYQYEFGRNMNLIDATSSSSSYPNAAMHMLVNQVPPPPQQTTLMLFPDNQTSSGEIINYESQSQMEEEASGATITTEELDLELRLG